jgi:hypothetical protein
MNSLQHPPEEPPRPRPEDLFRRELPALDTYTVPDDASGALPVSPFGPAALALAVIALALSLFPWVGLFIGVPAGLGAVALAIVAARQIRRGVERGAAWAAAAMALAVAAVVVGALLNLDHPFAP